jgi:hypothetical protein
VRRTVILGPAFVILIMLTGCPPTPVTLKTVVLSPTDISWATQYDNNNSGPCVSVPTYGTGPEPVNPGEIAVGWEDMFVPGAQPFPCNFQQQRIYRGHVQFDLRKLDTISDATLTYAVDHSENQGAGPAENPAHGYATVLGMSTGQIQGDQGPYWWNYDNDVTLPPCNGEMFTPCSVDVSNQANQWTQQNHFNYGFIFAGPKLSIDNSLPSDNNAQLSWYSGFKLNVLYNPALNPRAPQ